MNAVPAALFLVDFGSGEPAPALASDAFKTVDEAPDVGSSTRVEEAYARGVAEGKAAAQAQLEARLEEQKRAFQQDLAAARDTWCREEGARLAEHIEAAIRDMEGRIASSAERILRPFMAEAVCDRAVAELREAVQELIASDPDVTLEISGPEGLLDALRVNLSAPVASASYVVNDACDVRVKAGPSIIETRIAAWLAQLDGAGK